MFPTNIQKQNFKNFMLKLFTSKKNSFRNWNRFTPSTLLLGVAIFYAILVAAYPPIISTVNASHDQNRSLIPNSASSPSAFAPPAATYTDIPTGSYIINMGSASPTVANSLKPYGLVYALVKTNQVPVEWVIDPLKAKDGTDFSYAGVNYRGGSFIVRKEHITPAIVTLINTWITTGVPVTGPTTSDILSVPVAYTLRSFPNILINTENSSVVTAYFGNAGIPSSAYRVGTPATLNSCDDFFANAHGDPTVATHGKLLNFATTQKGYIWAACHSVSVLENLDDPAIAGSPNFNFLSQTGLVNYLLHEKVGSPPYTYDASAAGDPIMQFIGILDAATVNGSEEYYLPKTSWRPTTKIAVYDPIQVNVPSLSPGPAGVVVYGRAFGNSSNGMVMYEGGHDHGTGAAGTTIPASVAAQRAFFNFYILSGTEKGLTVNQIVPSNIVSGTTIPVSGSAAGGSGSYTYQWTSACGGTFASPTSLSTTFTAPTVSTSTPCILRLIATDTCSRTSFSASATKIGRAPKVKVTKKTKKGVGSFKYTGNNGFTTHTIAAAAPDVAVTGPTQTLTAPGTATTITEETPADFELDDIVCTGLGSGGTATKDLPNKKVTLDAAATAIESDIDCLFTGTKLAPELSIKKSSNGSWKIGHSDAKYTLTVTNKGTKPTSGTTKVRKKLPTGITAKWSGTHSLTSNGVTWGCTFSGQDADCDTPDSISHTGTNTSEITLPVNVTKAAPVGIDSITGYASVGGGGDAFNGGDAPTPGDTCTDADHCTSSKETVVSPDLTVPVSHTGKFIRGSKGKYTLTVSNDGTAPTSGTITVTDSLPSGLTVNGGAIGAVTPGGMNGVDWTCDSDAASPQNVTCSGSSEIPVSGASVFTLEADVSTSTASSVTNTAKVSDGEEADALNGNNTANDPTLIVDPPDLEVSIGDTGSFKTGLAGTYSITVTNSGGSPTTESITVIDTLPAGVSVNAGDIGAITTSGTDAADWSCNSDNVSPQKIECLSSAPIAESGVTVFTIPVDVGLETALGTDSITASATVSGGGEKTSTNNSSSDKTTVLSPNLTIAKSHAGSFAKGSTGTYTLSVSNSGTASSLGTITVTDTLPIELSVNGGLADTVVSGGANGVDWTCKSDAASPQIITCSSSKVITETEESVFTLAVNVSQTEESTVTNKAMVDGGSEATVNNGDNTASDPTDLVFAPPIVEMVKSCPYPTDCTAARQSPGTELTFNINLSNVGGQGAANMLVTDRIPDSTVYKVDSAAADVGLTGMIFTIEFSSDYDPNDAANATWTYLPVSEGGGAEQGFDANVKAIKWMATTGILQPGSTADLNFVTKIR